VKVVCQSGFVGSKQKFLGQSTGILFLCIWVCLACDEEHECFFFSGHLIWRCDELVMKNTSGLGGDTSSFTSVSAYAYD